MSDVMAELMELIDELEVEDADLSRIELAQKLRYTADHYPYVLVQMTPSNARALAADLEELAMLHVVPPTGEDG